MSIFDATTTLTNTARKFWADKGRGIAEFSSYNFVTADTNFDKQPGQKGYFDSPRPLPGPPTGIPIQTLLQADGTCPLPSGGGGGGGCGIECIGLPPGPTPPPANLPPACTLQGNVEFIATTVQDNYTGGSVRNDRASTLSIFDQDLKQYNAVDRATGQPQSAFSLNRFNFQAAYPFLIPKAVAYSAGLIDYFFRGRLEVNDVSDDDTRLFIEVQNVSGAKNNFTRGRFEVYYDAVDGTRKPLMVTQNATTGLAVDGRLELTATKPKLSDVDLSKDNPLTLVYRGRIGAEEGIATTVLEMPLSGFVVSPSPLAAGNPRNHVYFEDGTWRVSPYAGLAAGNIDWKGSINGHTKVLSWLGSKGKNIPDWTDFQLGAKPQPSPYIFQNGRVFAVAPAPVPR